MYMSYMYAYMLYMAGRAALVISPRKLQKNVVRPRLFARGRELSLAGVGLSEPKNNRSFRCPYSLNIQFDILA